MREIIIIGSIVILYANGVLPLAAVGFVIGLALGLVLVYNLGWNHRGKDDESDAIEGIRKKTAAKQR